MLFILEFLSPLIAIFIFSVAFFDVSSIPLNITLNISGKTKIGSKIEKIIVFLSRNISLSSFLKTIRKLFMASTSD